MTFHDEMVEKYGLPDWLPASWVYKPAGKNKRPVYGMGINDVEFSCQPTINGRRITHPAYDIWKGVIKRTHDPIYRAKNPSYNRVSLDPVWNTYSNFLNWFTTNYISGYDLDKDFLSPLGNSIYSETTCVFLPKELNCFLLSKKSGSDISLPIGVYRDKNRFRVSSTGKRFDDVVSAHIHYLEYKRAELRELYEKYNQYPTICKAMNSMLLKLTICIDSKVLYEF